MTKTCRNLFTENVAKMEYFHDGYPQHHLDGDWTLPPQPGAEATAMCFQKPDAVLINPKGPTGYRSPSPYAAGHDKFVVEAEVHGKGAIIDRLWETRLTHSGTTAFTCSLTPSAAIADVMSHNTVNALRAKILNNVREEVVDVAMVLAEMMSTVDTAVTLLDRIGRSMLALKRRKPESFYYLLKGRRRDNRRPTDRFLRETAGEYLQWKYGVMPTVYDLEGVSAGIDINSEGSLFSNPPLMVGRATIKENKLVPAFWQAPWESTRKDIYLSTEAKARIDFEVTAEGLRGLNRYGLGLTTIPTILWDKTPFTFVLDMLVPMAQIIKAWGALQGVNVIGYCETYYVKLECSGGTPPIEGNNVTNGRIYIFPKSDAMAMERLVFDRPPMPLPFVKNPFKTGNVSTVLALFTALRSPSSGVSK